MNDLIDVDMEELRKQHIMVATSLLWRHGWRTIFESNDRSINTF